MLELMIVALDSNVKIGKILLCNLPNAQVIASIGRLTAAVVVIDAGTVYAGAIQRQDVLAEGYEITEAKFNGFKPLLP